MNPILYWTLLALTCGYAFYRGERSERIVAAICVVASIVTVVVNSPLNQLYIRLDQGTLLVDIAVLAAFVAVALQSDRFWPLWVAGLQLTTSLAHLFKALDPDLFPEAYGAAVRFWSYPILLILAVGTWRGRHRPEGDHSPA